MPFPIKNIGLCRRAAAVGYDTIRSGCGERLKYHLGHKMAHLHPGSHGGRKITIDHGSFGSRHLNGPDRTLVDRNVRIKCTLYCHKHIGISEVIHHIYAPLHLGRGAFKIDPDIAFFDRY